MTIHILQDAVRHNGELAPQCVRIIARNLQSAPGIETLYFDFLGRVAPEMPDDGGYMVVGNQNGYAIYRFIRTEVVK